MACNIFCNSLWHEGGGEVIGHVPVTGRDLLHLGLRLVELRRLDVLVTLEHGALLKGAAFEEVVDDVAGIVKRVLDLNINVTLRSVLLQILYAVLISALSAVTLTRGSCQHIHSRRCPAWRTWGCDLARRE